MTGQYYYHAFLPEQPDLNWRHPQVRPSVDAGHHFADRLLLGLMRDELAIVAAPDA